MNDREPDIPADLKKQIDDFAETLKEVAKLPKAEREKYADAMREVIARNPKGG